MAKDIPQPAVGFVESFLPVNFKDVARPFHGHIDNVFDFTRPVSDDYHPVGERNRFHQVVGDENDGLALLFPNFQQLILKYHACLSIERPKRFVHKNDRWFIGQGANDGSPLAHTPGQLGRIIFLKSRQTRELDELLHLVLAFFSRIALGIETKPDILLYGQPRKELTFLWNITHLGIEPADFFILAENPPGGRRRKARDELQQSRFATTTGTDYGDELAVGDVQRNALERTDHPLARGSKKLGDVFNLDDRVVSWLG